MVQTPRMRRPGGQLFRKYVLLFMGLVSAALLVNAAIGLFFTYREDVSLLGNLQLEKADAATQRIEQFLGEIEREVGWTTYMQWAAGTLEQRRFDYFLLLRQVPAITEISQLDSAGKEQLKVSRLAMDVVGSQADFSKDPRFTEALAHKLWLGPVYFRNGSEPYLTMAVARAGHDAGVTVVEVNLKLIWDIISSVKVGQSGYAYVVDRRGRLIAHPDINLVLRNTDFSRLPYIAASLRNMADGSSAPVIATVEDNINGQRVLTAHAVLPELGWLVFVELPMAEALAPLYTSALRTGLVLLAGLALATLAAMFLARRMVGPIRLLQAGAARIGAGDLDSRIDVRTSDELQALAEQFNTMADELRRSQAGLERTVEERTRDLARSVTELQALSDVVRAVNSTLDLHVVLTKIVTHAVNLAQADAGAIFRHNAGEGTFELAESSGMGADLVAKLRSLRIASHETAMGEAALTRQPVQLADMAAGPSYPLREALVAAGFRSALVVPLAEPEKILGALVLVRRSVGEFVQSVVELTSTFATQSALAMQNASLFQQLTEKGRQLQLASEHKSQFLANMSHELRTPLNAILGYTELLVDGIYGDLPERPRGVLERVQENGRNLLALINDVLDLAKIEAGRLVLTPAPYRVADIMRMVAESTESLADQKHLKLRVLLAPDLPTVIGDEQRIAQVLMNLVGNAIKFSDRGVVEITAVQEADSIHVDVADEGPGIAPEDQARIFAEFHQGDDAITRQKGGTGLGLSISKRIVELHGGRLWVTSTPGHGATFSFTLPLQPAPALADA